MAHDKCSGAGLSDDPEVEALAEVMASEEGRLEQFLNERAIARGGFAKTNLVGEGRYAGCKADAEVMINKLNALGFDVVPIRSADVRIVPLR